MKKLIRAEHGWWEDRYTHFVAVDSGAALRYLQEAYPAIEWELTCVPERSEWFIAPKGHAWDSDSAYQLSEIDLAE